MRNMDHKITPAQLDAWRNLYVAFWKLMERIESDLAKENLPSLSWYDVLYVLHQAPERRLRMTLLAEQSLLSKSGLSRLVDRLEREKLLVRKVSAQDRRVLNAELTQLGAEMVRKMWPVYRAGIAAHFAAHVSDAEVQTIIQAFARIRAVGVIASAPGEVAQG